MINKQILDNNNTAQTHKTSKVGQLMFFLNQLLECGNGFAHEQTLAGRTKPGQSFQP
jgi:hypothetical protein